MRIWDVHPGYLNRQSLLGEHRELHGIVSILRHRKKGYSNHPETRRWKGYGWALRQRHRIIVSEMRLRGFKDQSPVTLRSNKGQWPGSHIDSPHEQFALLGEKYKKRENGRIPLPKATQELWAQHKYSVLARNPEVYQRIGKAVSAMKKREGFSEMATELTDLLRTCPRPGSLKNALQHMWGHVSVHYPLDRPPVTSLSSSKLLGLIQELTQWHRHAYLLESTALSDLGAWPESM